MIVCGENLSAQGVRGAMYWHDPHGDYMINLTNGTNLVFKKWTWRILDHSENDHIDVYHEI